MVLGPMTRPLLIVEDKASHARMLSEALDGAGYGCSIAPDVRAAVRLLRSQVFHLVLSDLRLPDGSGINVLNAVAEEDPGCPVIVMTAFGTIDDAVEAMKRGAVDFIQKPVDLDHLKTLVDRWTRIRQTNAENVLLREESGRNRTMPVIVGDSPAIRETAESVRRVASVDTTVLLLGESGTGKELFARAIHELSPRRNHPFVAINCAAIPETLLENELFGHEKGSFTGAGGRQIGKFELASGGTVFLDELAEMPPPVQAKLLRVLQEKSFERIGGTRTITTDVRIVCATNRDLEERVREGAFRDDLYYRVNVFQITVPPLRDRRDDIPIIVDHVIRKLQRELARPNLSISDDAVAALQRLEWPGNVRELQNRLERAAILCDREIRLTHLGIAGPESEQMTVDTTSGTLAEVAAEAIALAEKARIMHEMGRHTSRASLAAALGINVRTLSNKLRQYRLTSDEEDEHAD